jgi:Spy/CpxP family protein refolding chaperone
VSTATAGTALPRNWPRRRLLAALLAVSVVLNLFFIAGAMWTRLRPPPAAPGFEQRFHEMAAQLDLDPQQKLAFDQYEAAMRAGREHQRRQIAPLIDAVRVEIAKPQPDVKHIEQLLDQAAEQRRQFQHEAIGRTIGFMATLSAAQREKFVAIERERWAAHPHRH